MSACPYCIKEPRYKCCDMLICDHCWQIHKTKHDKPEEVGEKIDEFFVGE